jgi:hypothetical protein
MARTKRVPIKHESAVDGIVADAFSTLEELGGEMREAYDNMPQSLQGGDVGSRRNEAASTLEGLSQPDAPDCVAQLAVTYFTMPPKRRYVSRSARRDEATTMLSAVVEALDAWMDDDANAEHDGRDGVDSYRDGVQALLDEAEGVEFPGMYG